VLIRENGQWKVLYRETVEMVTEASELSRILNNFQELSKIFAKKFDKSVDKLQQSLPIVEHKLKEIKEKLKTEIPGIEDQLKGIAKELDDLFNSLQQAPPPEKEQSI
jgi:chaperonin cofactor prefoldin